MTELTGLNLVLLTCSSPDPRALRVNLILFTWRYYTIHSPVIMLSYRLLGFDNYSCNTMVNGLVIANMSKSASVHQQMADDLNWSEGNWNSLWVYKHVLTWQAKWRAVCPSTLSRLTSHLLWIRKVMRQLNFSLSFLLTKQCSGASPFWSSALCSVTSYSSFFTAYMCADHGQKNLCWIIRHKQPGLAPHNSYFY